MQHYLPRFALEVPILHSDLFVHLHLLLWPALPFFLLMRLLFLHQGDDLVAHESAFVNDVVEDGVAQELEVHSDLVGSASHRVALKQRRVCFAIVPYFFEVCFAVLDIIFLHFSFFALFFCDFFFFPYFRFLFFIWLFRFLEISYFLFDFCSDPIDPIFVREALDVCCQLFLIPLEIASDSSIVHLLHNLSPAFLVEERHFCFVLGEDQESAGAFVESMQHMQVGVVILVFEQVLDCVEVVPSSCVHNYAGRFVYHQIVWGLRHDANRKVEYWRLHSQGNMDDFISTFEDVFRRDLLMIDCDLPDFYRMPVVLWRVCFEFFDEGGQEGISDPPSLGKGPVGVGVGLHKPKREEMYENRPLLFFVVLLHCPFIYISFIFCILANPNLFANLEYQTESGRASTIFDGENT